MIAQYSSLTVACPYFTLMCSETVRSMANKVGTSRTTYNEDDVEKLRTSIIDGRARHLPHKEKNKNLNDIIHAVRQEIEESRQLGYTNEQICDMILEGGLKAARSTLRRYISVALSRKDTTRTGPASPSRGAGRKKATPRAPARSAPAASSPPGTFDVPAEPDNL